MLAALISLFSVNSSEARYEDWFQKSKHIEYIPVPHDAEPQGDNETSVPEIPASSPEPLQQKKIPMELWVRKNADYLLSALHKPGVVVIPAERFENAPLDEIAEWLLEKPSVSAIQFFNGGLRFNVTERRD